VVLLIQFGAICRGSALNPEGRELDSRRCHCILPCFKMLYWWPDDGRKLL